MKVKKKPILVEAWRLDSKNYDYPHWVEEAFYAEDLLYNAYSGKWTIHTLEGSMDAYDGDYLIRGVFGELYPCNKNVFNETYEIL